MSDKPHDEHATAARWARIYEAMTGASAPPGPHDHDVDVPGANPEAVKAGHEADRFDARGIVMVPVVVVVMAAIAYALVTALFSVFEFGKLDTSNVQSPQAAEQATRPHNERVATISSTDPHAKSHEPRLEFLKRIDDSRNGKAADPPFVRSFQPAEGGNSPEMTPQDLDPDRYTDPLTGKKLLVGYEYVNKEKGVARIPIAEAMKLVKLPAKKGTPNSSVGGSPKISNGGQTADGPAPKEEKKHEKH
jgi:hypothetical protein